MPFALVSDGIRPGSSQAHLVIMVSSDLAPALFWEVSIPERTFTMRDTITRAGTNESASRMALSATTLYQGEACVAAAGGTMLNPLRYTGIA